MKIKAFWDSFKKIVGNLGSGIERAGQGMVDADKKMQEIMKKVENLG